MAQKKQQEEFFKFFIAFFLIYNVSLSFAEEETRKEVAFIVSIENEGVYSLSNFLISLREEIINYKEG